MFDVGAFASTAGLILCVWVKNIGPRNSPYWSILGLTHNLTSFNNLKKIRTSNNPLGVDQFEAYRWASLRPLILPPGS
jgi:hypothetical protein